MMLTDVKEKFSEEIYVQWKMRKQVDIVLH